MHPNEKHAISVPLFSVLSSIGLNAHQNFNFFNTSSLFWSLTRLFGYYYRIVTVLDLSREARPFLDSDIEGFIIRTRIVLIMILAIFYGR